MKNDKRLRKNEKFWVIIGAKPHAIVLTQYARVASSLNFVGTSIHCDSTGGHIEWNNPYNKNSQMNCNI